MPFISNYNEAMKILSDINNEKCKKTCKTIWLRNIKYALKTKTNPLSLNKKQRKTMIEKIRNLSSRKKTKYQTRKSPPYPANENCNKKMIGNDGNMYISKPNKNNICSWKIIHS